MMPWRLSLLCGLLLAAGCAGPAVRPQSPEDLDQLVESHTRLVGDVARPEGNTFLKVEGVALVTNLNGSGENPAPSAQRAMLLHDLQTLGVDHPERVLADVNTGMVLIRGYLPPGAEKGDKFDVEVQVLSGSETSSLRGGWLMETRMKDVAFVANQFHQGHDWATGKGPILVDPAADETDRGLLVRGSVLGGGTVLIDRPLLLLVDDNPDVTGLQSAEQLLASQVGVAINRRFHNYAHGTQQGVANPINAKRIDLKVHPRYKDNLARYVRVVRSVPLRESPAERVSRLVLLERQLLDPITAPTAALRLEAIGHDGVKALLKGLDARDPEVRFYAAEALAYLDEAKAAVPLAKAAREEPAFRAYALAALSAMDDMEAYDALVGLLDVPSAETRYGAFRALWAMNPHDARIRGEELGGQFGYHVLNTERSPMIHVTRSFRPEIVLFGHEQHFEVPFLLEAGKSILIKGEAADKVTISCYARGRADQKRVVTSKVNDVIRAVVELGGSYPDVVQALQQAKANHFLASRLEVDALPDGGRIYHRDDEPATSNTSTTAQLDKSAASDDEQHGLDVASPLPSLYAPTGSKSSR